MPFIRKRKLQTLNNEILRLSHVNDAWEAQNKSDLNELRKVQEECAKLRKEISALESVNQSLKAALNRAHHNTPKGGHIRHGH